MHYLLRIGFRLKWALVDWIKTEQEQLSHLILRTTYRFLKSPKKSKFLPIAVTLLLYSVHFSLDSSYYFYSFHYLLAHLNSSRISFSKQSVYLSCCLSMCYWQLLSYYLSCVSSKSYLHPGCCLELKIFECHLVSCFGTYSDSSLCKEDYLYY